MAAKPRAPFDPTSVNASPDVQDALARLPYAEDFRKAATMEDSQLPIGDRVRTYLADKRAAVLGMVRRKSGEEAARQMNDQFSQLDSSNFRAIGYMEDNLQPILNEYSDILDQVGRFDCLLNLTKVQTFKFFGSC
jgi:hypothetical protein